MLAPAGIVNSVVEGRSLLLVETALKRVVVLGSREKAVVGKSLLVLVVARRVVPQTPPPPIVVGATVVVTAKLGLKKYGEKVRGRSTE